MSLLATGATQHTFAIPAYGDSPYLGDCLASLRNQNRPSLIVVSTSTPTDAIRSLAHAYGAELFVHSPNAGIGRDWNVALSRARTPWVTIAHQDDVYAPNFVDATLASTDLHTILVLTGYAELAGDSVRTVSPMLLVKRLLLEIGFLGRHRIDAAGAKRRLLQFGCPIPCPSVTLRIDRTGLRFREDLRVNLDWEAWLRLAAEPGTFAYSRQRLLLHRIHRNSETMAGVREGVRAREDLMMFESLWPRPLARLIARGYALSYAQSG